MKLVWLEGDEEFVSYASKYLVLCEPDLKYAEM